jgi:hypothetical protein
MDRVINLNDDDNNDNDNSNSNELDIFGKLDEIKNQPDKKTSRKSSSRSRKKPEPIEEKQEPTNNDNDNNNDTNNDNNNNNDKPTMKKANVNLDEDEKANKREQLIVAINNYLGSRFKGERLKKRGFTSTGLEKKTTAQLETYLKRIKASSHAQGSSQAFEMGSMYALSQYEKMMCKINLDISGTTQELSNNEMFLENLEEVYIEHFSYINPSPVSKLCMTILGTSFTKYQENRIKKLLLMKSNPMPVLNNEQQDNTNKLNDNKQDNKDNKQDNKDYNKQDNKQDKPEDKFINKNNNAKKAIPNKIELTEDEKLKMALTKLKEASE